MDLSHAFEVPAVVHPAARTVRGVVDRQFRTWSDAHQARELGASISKLRNLPIDLRKLKFKSALKLLRVLAVIIENLELLEPECLDLISERHELRPSLGGARRYEHFLRAGISATP
ncbi:hypothetical protein [Streptomyces phaeochromogenes]|uniref:hypothetical protein n=1 Tax=Streptomyces phaeochromogenes TaxID=1923 RepID=UPI003400C101